MNRLDHQPIDLPEDPVFNQTRADLEALQRRQEHRRVADAKRSWAPTVLGGFAALLTGVAVFYDRQYRAMGEVIRVLRHAEKEPDRFAEMMKIPQLQSIYNRFAKPKQNVELAAMAGVKKLAPNKTLTKLFDRFSSPDYVSVNDDLRQFATQPNYKNHPDFRVAVNQEIMDRLDMQNIVTMRREHLSEAAKAETIVFAVVAGIAAGAVVYGITHLLTSENDDDKKRREQDDAMAETARSMGFMPLKPSAQTKNVTDFRERLEKARQSLAGHERIF